MTQRLFIAINLDAATKLALVQIITQFPDTRSLNKTKSDNLHLTLQFLGDTEVGLIPEIQDILKSIADQYPQFELNCTRWGAFPNFQQPHTIWIGVAGPRLLELQTALTKQLSRIVLNNKNTKPFQPHLTLARVKFPLSSNDLTQIQSLATKIILPPPTSAKSLDLMASTLTPRGPIHSLVSRHLFVSK